MDLKFQQSKELISQRAFLTWQSYWSVPCTFQVDIILITCCPPTLLQAHHPSLVSFCFLPTQSLCNTPVISAGFNLMLLLTAEEFILSCHYLSTFPTFWGWTFPWPAMGRIVFKGKESALYFLKWGIYILSGFNAWCPRLL